MRTCSSTVRKYDNLLHKCLGNCLIVAVVEVFAKRYIYVLWLKVKVVSFTKKPGGPCNFCDNAEEDHFRFTFSKNTNTIHLVIMQDHTSGFDHIHWHSQTLDNTSSNQELVVPLGKTPLSFIYIEALEVGPLPSSSLLTTPEHTWFPLWNLN